MKTEKRVSRSLVFFLSVDKALLVDKYDINKDGNLTTTMLRRAIFMWPKAVPQVLIDANKKEKVYCGKSNALRGS